MRFIVLANLFLHSGFLTEAVKTMSKCRKCLLQRIFGQIVQLIFSPQPHKKIEKLDFIVFYRYPRLTTKKNY